jgi:hypothetical protein
MCSNGLYKKNSLIQICLPFWLSMLKNLSNFQKEWCTFGRKKKCLKKKLIVHFQGLSGLVMQKKKCIRVKLWAYELCN